MISQGGGGGGGDGSADLATRNNYRVNWGYIAHGVCIMHIAFGDKISVNIC